MWNPCKNVTSRWAERSRWPWNRIDSQNASVKLTLGRERKREKNKTKKNQNKQTIVLLWFDWFRARLSVKHLFGWPPTKWPCERYHHVHVSPSEKSITNQEIEPSHSQFNDTLSQNETHTCFTRFLKFKTRVWNRMKKVQNACYVTSLNFASGTANGLSSACTLTKI